MKYIGYFSTTMSETQGRVEIDTKGRRSESSGPIIVQDLFVRYTYADGTVDNVDYSNDSGRSTVLTSADTRNRLYQLTKVEIGSGWTAIGAKAFWNCKTLNYIAFFSATAPVIGTDAFLNIAPVGTLFCPSGADYSKVYDALPIGWKDGDENTGSTVDTGTTIEPLVGLLVRYTYEDNSVNLVNYAPDDGTERGTILTKYDVRSRIYQLKKIEFGNGWTGVGDQAFWNCSTLEEITFFSATAPSIGTNAFLNIGLVGTLYHPSGADYSSVIASLPIGWRDYNGPQPIMASERMSTFAAFDDDAIEEVELAAEPVIISTKSEGLFAPVKSSSASITLMLDTYKMDLYTAEAQGVSANVFLGNECIWSGYVTPMMYSQGFRNPKDEITLECIHALSTLKYFDYPFKIEGEYNNVTFKEVLDKLSDKAGVTFDYNNSNTSNISIDGTYMQFTDVLSKLSINEGNFVDDDDEKTVWTCEEVLEEICKYLCVSAVAYKDRVVFVSYPYAASRTPNEHITKDSYRQGGGTISLTESYGEVTISVNEYHIEETLPEIFSEDNDAKFYDRRMVWKNAAREDDDDNFDGDTWHYERKEHSKYGIENEGIMFYNRFYKQKGAGYECYWYDPNGNPVGDIKFESDINGPFYTEWDRVVLKTGSQPGTSIYPPYIGCLPVKCADSPFNMNKEDESKVPSYKDTFMISRGLETTLGAIGNKHKDLPMITINTGINIIAPPSGSTTYIIIKGKLRHTMYCSNILNLNIDEKHRGDFIPWASSKWPARECEKNDDGEWKHYPLFMYECKVGNQYYINPRDLNDRLLISSGEHRCEGEIEVSHHGYWQTPLLPTDYKTSIMWSKPSADYSYNKDYEFDSNLDFYDSVDEDGFAIPIHHYDDVGGPLTFTIYNPFVLTETWKWVLQQDHYPMFSQITDFDIKVVTVSDSKNPLTDDDEKTDDDVIFVTGDNRNYVSEWDDVEIKVHTQQPDRDPSLGAVIVAADPISAAFGANGKYLGKIRDSILNKTQYQEENIIGHYYNHFKKPKFIYDMVSDHYYHPSSCVDYPTQFGNRRFIVDQQVWNVSEEHNNIKIIEY